MKLYMTRDSVGAGDDIGAPHGKEVEVRGALNFDGDGIFTFIKELNYLPKISGGKATWTLSSIEPLAVFAQEWNEPKKISFLPIQLSALDVTGDTLNLHFSYHRQTPPQTVLEILKQLKLKAMR